MLPTVNVVTVTQRVTIIDEPRLWLVWKESSGANQKKASDAYEEAGGAYEPAQEDVEPSEIFGPEEANNGLVFLTAGVGVLHVCASVGTVPGLIKVIVSLWGSPVETDCSKITFLAPLLWYRGHVEDGMYSHLMNIPQLIKLSSEGKYTGTPFYGLLFEAICRILANEKLWEETPL